MKNLIFSTLIISLLTFKAYSQSYNFTNGQTINTCSGTLYDPNGPSGPTTNQTVQWTEYFCTSTPGCNLQMKLNSGIADAGCNGPNWSFNIYQGLFPSNYGGSYYILNYDGNGGLITGGGTVMPYPHVITTSYNGCFTLKGGGSQYNLNINLSCTKTPNAVLTLTATGNTTICSPDSVKLTATAPPFSSSLFTFQWYKNGTLISGASGDIYYAKTSGVYKSLMNDGCSSVFTPTVTITVNPSPGTAVIPAGTNSLCVNSVNSTFTTTSTNATSYNWSILPANAGTIAGTTSTAVVDWNNTYTGAASITANGINACGNGVVSNPLVVNIYQYPNNPIVPTGTINLCQNITNTNYTTSVVTNATNYIWHIYPPTAGTISGTTNTGTVTWNNNFTGNAYIKVKAVNGICESLYSDSLQVLINPTPNVTINASNIGFCPNDSVKLFINSLNNHTYQWQFNNNNIPNATDTAVFATQQGNYIVLVENSFSCSTSDTILITEYSNPNANAGSDVAVCENNPVTLVATGGNSYSWSNGISQNTPFVPLNSGIYYVTVTNNNGCSAIDSLLLTLNSLPPVPTISQNALVLMSSSSTGNQWILNGSDIIGANSQFYTVTTSGFYQVEVTDINGCSSISNVINMVVTSMNNNNFVSYLSIFPNPNNGVFSLECFLKEMKNVSIEIVDNIGNVVYKSTEQNYSGKLNKSIDLKNQAKGIYLVNVKIGDKIFSERISIL